MLQQAVSDSRYFQVFMCVHALVLTAAHAVLCSQALVCAAAGPGYGNAVLECMHVNMCVAWDGQWARGWWF